MIRLFQPNLGDQELKAVQKTFSKSWIGLGEEVSNFEREFKEYIGSSYALALNSGSAALQLAIESFGFKKGKKVLVNNLTFIASATCILHNNLEPVLIDCNEDDLGINLEDAEKKVDKNTVALIVVHYAGHPAPMDKIMKFANQYNLKVIEDCAHCVGGTYKDKFLGTWGDIGCFSFEEKKGMTSGDGGMMVSNNENLIEKMRPNRWLGIDKDTWKRNSSYTSLGDLDTLHWHYEVSDLGFKYNMNDLSASIARVQLRRLKEFNSKRSYLVKLYLSYLENLDFIKPLINYDLNYPAYWIFGIRSYERDKVIRQLKSKGISTGVHYMPVSKHPLFRTYDINLPISTKIWKQFITLPLHTKLEEKDIRYVCQTLISYSD